jgi:phage-related baseplate assembly protein
MSLDLLNTDPKQFLDAFKTAYYEQTGETLQIGSDYFAVASVYAYCLSVFFNAVNDATQNRFIDYATGEYLDAIATNYGIESRPDGYHATARFNLVSSRSYNYFEAGQIVVSDDSGNQFYNRYTIAFSDSPYSVVLYAVQSGTRYNGIPANTITNLDSLTARLLLDSATNTSMTEGGTDGFPYTTDGDNAYRQWLETQIQSFAGAGTYEAYEARARNADPRVDDVYVLRQDDEGYAKGKVKIYILASSRTADVVDIVQASCSDESFRPIGDLVVVQAAQTYSIAVNGTVRISYPEKFKDVANERNTRIIAAYNELLARHINKPFVIEELCAMLVAEDEYGVWAYDAKPMQDLSTYYTPRYPTPGSVLQLTNLYTSNYIVYR